MKWIYLLSAFVFAGGGFAAEPLIVDRGPHSRTWGRLQEIQTPRGTIIRTNVAYVELATGMHRWSAESREWTLASPRIEVIKDGAVVRGLQYSVIFSHNLASSGAVDIQMMDGQRLTGHLLGLAYSEGDKSVLIAEVTDCTAEIVGAEQNELIFRNAFTDFAIDVKYTVARHKFSQDLIVRERLPSPTRYGLSENARLEVLTEWTTAPAPQRQVRVVEPAHDGQTALTDEELSFGSMLFGNGRAFSVGDEANDEAGIPVAKGWEQMRDDAGNVRTFLVEKVPWSKVAPEMQKLPPPQAKAGRVGSPGQPKTKDDALLAQGTNPGRVGSPGRPGEQAGAPSGRALPDVAFASPASSVRTIAGLPAPRQKRAALKPIQVASIDVPGAKIEVQGSRLSASTRPAFVLDYEQVLSPTNITFRSDTTYYVSGPVTLTGTNALEGGTVIKYANTNTAQIALLGSDAQLLCLGSSHRPIVLTGHDDDTVGEQIPSSTGVPTNYYARYGFWFGSSTPTIAIEHMHVRYAKTAFAMNLSSSPAFRHCQILSCGTAFWLLGASPTVTVENLLASSVTNFVLALNGVERLNAQHLTLHQATNLNWNGQAILSLTNCLLVAVGSTNGYSGANNAIEASGSGVFQTVGAGDHYLAENSTNRNAGTTNIDATVLADLRQRTTYPPVVLTNALTADLTLAPQAQRDTDTPDLGYHYAPIDYAVNLLNVSNVVLTLTNGVVLASFGQNGIWLHDGATLISEGTPTARNHLCRFNCVQEQATNWGSGSVNQYMHVNSGSDTTNRPSGRFRFTDFDVVGTPNVNLLYHCDTFVWRSLTLRDCELGAGNVILMDNLSDTELALTNNLFHRTYVYAWSEGTVFFFNNLFVNAMADLYNTSTNLTLARDNAFDFCTMSTTGVSNTHTAYINMTDRFDPTNSNDRILTNLAWQTGPLGRYYQPTNSALIDTGSRSATNAGLYHYTTTTNQVKEGTTTVDIGLHYVAVTNIAGVWVPIDTDGDGLADYFEDANGNGVLNSAETDWNDATDPGLKVWITKPRGGSGLP